MRTPPLFLACSITLLFGCADQPWPRPPSLSFDEFLTIHHEWRADRRDRLVRPPYGPAIWVGLWELAEGATSIGADSSHRVVLPRPAPDNVGTMYRTGTGIEFEPASGAAIHVADGPRITERMTVRTDRADSATDFAIGSLRFRVHGERGTDRLWIRAWDIEHPAIETFGLPDEYRPDTIWRLAARFEPFDEPRTYTVPDVWEGTQEFRATGSLVFQVAGETHRLLAFSQPTSTTFFIMFRDATAATTTYQAGRYVRTALPDSTGWTVLDFNRAYNPSCVFSEYSTCALPPPENRLTLAIEAGAKRR